jgi:cytochrome c-type biogenesis protein CcmE
VTGTETVAPPPPAGPVPRAPKRRARYVAAVAVCGLVVIVAVVLLVALADNVVFYRTVSEAVHDRPNQGTSRFRLAGAVVPGSVHETQTGVDFSVTDGRKTVRVVHEGDPPELFKPRAPVVCEGRWGRGLVFDSDRILIRHGSKYTPPKVDADKAPQVSKQ